MHSWPAPRPKSSTLASMISGTIQKHANVRKTGQTRKSVIAPVVSEIWDEKAVEEKRMGAI